MFSNCTVHFVKKSVGVRYVRDASVPKKLREEVRRMPLVDLRIRNILRRRWIRLVALAYSDEKYFLQNYITDPTISACNTSTFCRKCSCRILLTFLKMQDAYVHISISVDYVMLFCGMLEKSQKWSKFIKYLLTWPEINVTYFKWDWLRLAEVGLSLISFFRFFRVVGVSCLLVFFNSII